MSTRADIFLVEHGFAASRAEAQAAIRAGNVRAAGMPVLKPSQPIALGAEISYVKAHPYVSRGALKLVAALDRFGLSPADRTCLDIGASTGGFTEVLLERGARRVYAVDVGHGQLRAKLKTDPRVVCLEGTDARHLTVKTVPEPPQVVVADTSFISLKLVLAAALPLARDAWLVALVKPQFEAGRENVGKGGIVRDETARAMAVQSIARWLEERRWTVLGTMESPITGGDGNREYLVAARQTR